ncbi:SdpA family antimicrobial peptide system protein [Pyxidicoccus trucidator]|uniref:SdpA family antimicrobial peptide system protein n=1 Tax=Pyxidicoccus trucidator TaxID=2709662 RepID=UPI0013DCE6DC|nr:SdpA family antimicrobial peptide system protein [Pyxidicoccus trucidator]
MISIGYVIYPTLPYSPVRLPFAQLAQTFLWAPQGWSFFTRDPREQKQTLYVRHGDQWESTLLAPHGRLSNIGGLRRKSRSQGVEMALLLSRVPANEWQECSAPLEECLAKQPTGRPLRNTSPAPTLCGTVAVVQQKPVPWAWARSARPVTMPFRILSMDVSC